MQLSLRSHKQSKYVLEPISSQEYRIQCAEILYCMTSQTNAKALGIQRSILKGAFHEVLEGAPVTRPVGVLDTYIRRPPVRESMACQMLLPSSCQVRACEVPVQDLQNPL